MFGEKLGLDNQHFDSQNGGMFVPVAFDTTQITSPANRSNPQAGDPCHPLAAQAHPPAVAFSIMPMNSGKDAGEEISPTLRAMTNASSHANGGGQVAVAYGIRSDASREGVAKTPSADAEGKVRLRNPGLGIHEELAPTLDASAPHAVAFALRGREEGAVPEVHEAGDTVGTLRAAEGGSSRDYLAVCATGEVTHTLKAEGFDASEDGSGRGQPAVAFQSATEFLPQSSRVYSEGEAAPTLQATGSRNGNRTPQILAGILAAVRRLTTVECARLQGFADDYLTSVTWRGQCPPADGPQYKALGNSWAVPNVAWIGRRLDAHLRTLSWWKAAA